MRRRSSPVPKGRLMRASSVHALVSANFSPVRSCNESRRLFRQNNAQPLATLQLLEVQVTAHCKVHFCRNSKQKTVSCMPWTEAQLEDIAWDLKEQIENDCTSRMLQKSIAALPHCRVRFCSRRLSAAAMAQCGMMAWWHFSAHVHLSAIFSNR